MRKRLFFSVVGLFLSLLIPFQASAATISYWLYFIPSLDQYKMDFTYPTGTVDYNVHFVAADNTTYDRTWTNPTGVLYLTCNGTYSVQFFDSTGVQIGEFYPFQTTEIVNPTCDSYPKATGSDDLNATVTDQGGGNYQIDWTPPPAGGHTEVYQDGQQVYSGTDSTYTGTQGSYTIINYDSTGTEVGRTDKYVPDGYDGTGGTGGSGETATGGGSSCDGCQLLTEMLSCPGWTQYMGDLTQAIQNALPPPPDWDAISEKIGDATIRHLSDYLGNVPEAPSETQIKNDTNQPMPIVDNTVPEADQLTPTVPDDFNTPIPFDIENGPQIDVTDDSHPFSITDPLAGMQIDDPGTPVIPGDSRNSSGGIKTPDNPDTGGPPTPAPGPTDSGEPGPTPAPPTDSPPPVPSGDPENVPPTEMPMPSDTGGSGPTPTIPSAEIPVPTIIP